MVLPNNGKIIIIDDRPDEVKGLMTALNKEKMPYLYYYDQGESDLPDEPILNIRLIFLDLDLGIGQNEPVQKIRIVQSRLSKVLIENTPYLLIIWSNHETEYLKFLLDDFDNEFKMYKPVAYCSLDKSILYQQDIDIVNYIRNNLKEKLVNFKSYRALLAWETIVNESSGKMITEIASLYPPDGDWDSKIKLIFYKLAHAYSGKAMKSFDSIKQLKNALYTLTQTFTDNIEILIDKMINDDYQDLVCDSAYETDYISILMNKLLLISDCSDNVTQTGNIFFPIPELKMAIQNEEEYFASRMFEITKIPIENQEVAKKNTKLKFEFNKERITKRLSKYSANYNEIVASALIETAYEDEKIRNDIFENFYEIELNVTPLCDYAQEKAKMYRILPGVILKSKYREYINSNLQYAYTSGADILLLEDSHFFHFDFRFLYSLDSDEMLKRQVIFRFKHQLVSDIQIKLSSHINRAGVVFIST